MRLATITNWAYGVTVALTLGSASTMLIASRAQDRERTAVADRNALDGATSHVDEDVEGLSGLARHYAVTAEPADLVAYEREAALLKPVEARTAHIRDAGASDAELQTLHEALRWADALQGQQRAAMMAQRSGRSADALHILFAPEYERELDRMRASVEQFQARIDQRTATALDSAVGTSRLWRSVSEIVLGATGLLFLAVLYFIFRRRVLRPVVKLSDVVTRLAAQDYAAEPPACEQIDEIGDMAQALRVFRDNGVARQQLEAERDADRVVRDLLSRMTQRMQGCDTVADLEEVVRCFVPELVPQCTGSLYLLDRARNAMVASCSWLDPLPPIGAFAPTHCWALRRGGEHRVGANLVDVPCAHLQHDAGARQDAICMPLAAQTGILGLLTFALRPGFVMEDVPGADLKMLAENIGLALDNLRLRDALREMALADPLTTLANRRRLDLVLGELATAPKQPISCIMLDIDRFKQINDVHGHEAGDAVLRAAGAAIKDAVRPEDLAVRYGGEEFLILLPGLDAAGAHERAEQIRVTIANLRPTFEGRDLGPVTISAGVAGASAGGDVGRLVAMADAALLRAKGGGRNRVVGVPPAAKKQMLKV